MSITMSTVSINKQALNPIAPGAPGSPGISEPLGEVVGRRTVGRLVVPPKRYKVGELVSATGLSRQTLHNYTKWGLIGETGWTPGGHRLYDESVFARLERVMQLKATRTVEQVRELMAIEDREQAA